MLTLEGVHAGYGPVKVLYGIDLAARPGEILCLLGRNGAGKTTIMRAIMGLVPVSAGRVALDGQALNTLPPHQVAGKGLGYVPQGRRLWPDLTVAETLQMGLMAGKAGAPMRDRLLTLFPRLAERLHQRAGTLSGGEQQMLATARALALEPKVLLLDEPTEGLQPSMIALIRDVVVQMRDAGLAVVLVEQRVDAVLAVADTVAFVENGHNLETLPAADLRADPARLHRYLGV